MAETIRSGLLVRTCLDVLRYHREPVWGAEVLDEVAGRIELTDVECRPGANGVPAWVTDAGFYTGNAATIGWMIKRNGLWWLTDTGRAALDEYPGPDGFVAEIGRRYREFYRRRKQSRLADEINLGGSVGVPVVR